MPFTEPQPAQTASSTACNSAKDEQVTASAPAHCPISPNPTPTPTPTPTPPQKLVSDAHIFVPFSKENKTHGFCQTMLQEPILEESPLDSLELLDGVELSSTLGDGDADFKLPSLPALAKRRQPDSTVASAQTKKSAQQDKKKNGIHGGKAAGKAPPTSSGRGKGRAPPTSSRRGKGRAPPSKRARQPDSSDEDDGSTMYFTSDSSDRDDDDDNDSSEDENNGQTAPPAKEQEQKQKKRSRPPPPSWPLSEYEKKRLATMEHNQSVLQEIEKNLLNSSGKAHEQSAGEGAVAQPSSTSASGGSAAQPAPSTDPRKGNG